MGEGSGGKGGGEGEVGESGEGSGGKGEGSGGKGGKWGIPTPLSIPSYIEYIENFTTKKTENFQKPPPQKKTSYIFHISAQNIDCGTR